MSVPPADPAAHQIAAQQARFNRSTRGHWQHFATHRERIEHLLVADGLTGGGRLCVLGAGNCNDLDLRHLCETFAEVHLVDLDPAAVAGAVRRQEMEASSQVRLHAPVDLTGVADDMAGWPGRRPTGGEIDACIRKIGDAPLPALTGPFDVVLSPCVLSQIVGYANDTLGKAHPRLHLVRRALRDRHLRLMVDAVAPGGWGVLVTDACSSAGVDGLDQTPHDKLPDLLRSLEAFGHTYPGLGPAAVEAELRREPLLALQAADVRVIPPWLWRLGPLKTFLVYAVRFRRARGTILL